MLKELFPTLKDEDLQIVRENLDAYLELAWGIYEDMKARKDDVDRDPDTL